jgi:hypothetical protein
VKRPHGTGTQYVTWGSFYGRWTTLDGRRVNRRIGKVRVRGESDGLTRAQAERGLRRLSEAESLRPRPSVEEPPRTVDEVADELRGRLAIEGARLSYRQNCEAMQRVHISPAIGKRRVDSVTRADVERLARSMLERGLAPKTVRNVMTFLHSVFALAVESEWTASNPVARAARPRRRREGDVDPDLQFLTLSELDAVIAAIPDRTVDRDVLGPVLRLSRLAKRRVAGRGAVWESLPPRKSARMKLATSALVGALAALAFASPATAGTAVSVGNGKLAITGDDGPNSVSIELSDDFSAWELTIGGGIDSAVGCESVSAQQLRCPFMGEIDASSSVHGSSEGMGAGNDSFTVAYGSDNAPQAAFIVVDLGPGNDVFGGSEMNDHAFGGSGNDVLDGGGGHDILGGGDPTGVTAGADKVLGGPGSDEVFDGDTTLDHGPDLLDGGSCSQAVHPSCPVSPWPANAADKDMVNYNAIDAGRTADLTLNLLDATASQGESDEGDTVRNIESAITGEGDDTVTGNSAANELNTNGGTTHCTSRAIPAAPTRCSAP